jgi:glycosyltransferase involved in cell wall biosynthesis
MGLNQPPGTKKWFLQLPDWFLSFYLFLVKHGVNLGKFSRPWVHALVWRADFLRHRLNQIDKIAIPTRIMGKLLIQNGLEKHRTFDLPFGLNNTYSMTKKNTHNEPLQLGYIGTLADYKGVHVLIKAMQLLPERPIKLKIYGKMNDYPDYTETLMDLSKNDSRIEFCGTFPNNKIGAIFAELDALVVPSLWYENSPLVVYSAQSAHCPVIASNMPGISEIIENEKNGLLFEVGNIQGLARQIERIVDDRGLLSLFVKNAKAPLSIQEYVDRILEINNELKGGVVTS